MLKFLISIANYQTPIAMVIGEPIPVKQVANPTEAQVDELHQKFIEALQSLFDEYKSTVGWQHKKLEII